MKLLLSLRPIALVLGVLLIPSDVMAQKITVKSATPASGSQGTVGLDVTVGGSGFSPGDRADFLKSGTVDPAGVRVNRTTFVSNTQLIANIDIDDLAALSLFDIKVSNASRSGKGTDLFRVDAKAEVCVIPETDPAHFQLVATFNGTSGGAAAYTNQLGTSLGLGEADVPLPDGSTREVLVVFSGTSGSGTAEVFFVDPFTGSVVDGSSLGGGAPVQPHVTATLPYPSTPPYTPSIRDASVGDLNGDGIPDAVMSDNGDGVLAGLLSHVTNGVVGFSVVSFPIPTSPDITFGMSLTVAEMDGNPGLEIAVAQAGQNSRKLSVPSLVYVYRLAPDGNSFVLLYTVAPSLPAENLFGRSLDVGDVTGDGRPDLLTGDAARDFGNAADAGAVLVFPGTGNAPPYRFSNTPLVLSVSTPKRDDRIGSRVFVGNTDSDPTGQVDVVALSGTQALLSVSAPPIRGVVFRGPLTAATKETASATFGPPLPPASANGWGGTVPLVADLDQNGFSDLVVAAPGAEVTSACTNTGAVYIFFGQGGSQFSGWQRAQILQPSSDPSAGDFGWSVAVAPSRHLLFVGDIQRAVGGVEFAGQIYVYRVF